MDDWHVFSTTDMETWVDYDVAFLLNDLSWTSFQAWASDCIYRNGKYFLLSCRT